MRPAEWFQGLIDEVRVSDVALAPAEFLFAPKSEMKLEENAEHR